MPDGNTCSEVVCRLESLGNRKNVQGMARFGIRAPNALGVSAPNLKQLAREIGKNHQLAGQLWKTGIHDARLLATLAIHDKEAPDECFEQFWPYLIEHVNDERNFVKKGINWALRQIGKRNRHLNRLAIRTAKQIKKLDSRSARWIAADALRELTDEKVKARLKS